jgi:dihydrodipicolinate synthase/N-acetylneuraminate lyase
MVLLISKEFLERSNNAENIYGVKDTKFDLQWHI